MKKILYPAFSLLLFACTGPKTSSFIAPEGNNIETRFTPPDGYSREMSDNSSFESYLRKLPLKPIGSMVSLYDGRIKDKEGVYDAVVDLPIGTKDLHQCADAIMRLRAEYLFSQQRYESIHFNFTSGFRADYSKWMQGNRIRVRGNEVSWVKQAEASSDYPSFWKYLEIIFAYCGTLSLDSELKQVESKDLQTGDVFIRGGSPGHAVIVVDVAENHKTGKKVFLLAQSYMPAQEIQILKNPGNPDLSPWYELDFGVELITPEWKFVREELKRF